MNIYFTYNIQTNSACWYFMVKFIHMNSKQCMTLNIFKDCHSGYLNLKIYSQIRFCRGHVFQWHRKHWVRSFNSHVGYKILRSHSPEEFFTALANRLLLKPNTAKVIAVYPQNFPTLTVLWIRGRPVAKCDPLLSRAIQLWHANFVLITKKMSLKYKSK